MNPKAPEFLRLARDVAEIKSALIGDPMKGKNGFIHQHNQLVEDFYGLDSNGNPIEGKTNTFASRVSNLEDKQKKVLWVFTGIVSLALAIKFGIATVLGKIFEK